MAEATTTNRVNVSQLCYELGKVPLHSVGPDVDGVTTIDTEAVGASVLAAAVKAHIANPGWVDPDAVPPAASAKEVAQQKVASVPAGPIRQALLAIIEAI